MKFEIWVDADSVPINLRAIIVNRGIKDEIPVHFVADRELKDIKVIYGSHTGILRKAFPELSQEEKREIKSWIHMHVVPTGSDSADNFIAENAEPESLVITHDIPLAERLLKKGLRVIDDRGGIYNTNTIRERMSNREINKKFREKYLFVQNKEKKMGQKETREFANAFDRECTSFLSK